MKNEKLAEMKRADAFPLGKGRRANLTFLRKKTRENKRGIAQERKCDRTTTMPESGGKNVRSINRRQAINLPGKSH